VPSSAASLWACPQCHTELPASSSRPGNNTLALSVDSRIVHDSASLDGYADACPRCGLPYTAVGVKRFEYPYRQMLAKIRPRKFLRWSAAQNNGFVSYALMRGASCSVEGREDVRQFSEFISQNLTSAPGVVLDFGCGPLARPAYLPAFPDATLIGVDPFDSEWSGSFVQGVGEFLPLKDSSVDMAMAATALDHAMDLGVTLRELARVTKTGGSLMVWDHTFQPRWRRLAETGYTLLQRVPLSRKIAVARWNLFRERVRVYDNGIVLWTPKGYADPFHEPRSRRPSWPRTLRKAIEAAGFVRGAENAALGLSHYTRA
jgi:SAM-dependent methyltransferase